MNECSKVRSCLHEVALAKHIQQPYNVSLYIVIRATERYEAVTMRVLKSWDAIPFRNNLLSRVFYKRRYKWATETEKKTRNS